MLTFDDKEKNRRVLVIDDNPSIHEDFRKILSEDNPDVAGVDEDMQRMFGDGHLANTHIRFEIDSAFQGQAGLAKVCDALNEGRPYALAFVDVRMPPGWDGIKTTQHIWEADPRIQIVICTAFSDYSIDQIIELFGPTDQLLILKKPYDIAEASLLAITMTEKWNLSRKANAFIDHQAECIDDAQGVLRIIEGCQRELQSANVDLKREANHLSDRLQQRTAEILGTRDVAVMALAQLAESRDPETGEHLARMRAISQILAEHLAHHGPYTHEIDDRFLDEFYRSTPLHDIGKVGIPDEILLKPGRLSRSEIEIMKRHTLIGAHALETSIGSSSCGDFLKMAIDIAKCHHERFDGTGYPFGIMGLRIPLCARIVAVADVFDALTSKRVYKNAMDPNEARHMIVAESGKHFDPEVVAAFEACFDKLISTMESIDRSTTKNSPLRDNCGFPQFTHT